VSVEGPVIQLVTWNEQMKRIGLSLFRIIFMVYYCRISVMLQIQSRNPSP